MEFNFCNEISVSDFNLLSPIFNNTKNIFISNLHNSDQNTINIKGINFKLLEYSNNMLNLEFLHMNNDLYLLVLNLDKIIKEQIISKGTIWFGNNLNNDTINNLYKSSIISPLKIPALPFMKFNVSEDCKITNKRKKISLSDLKKGMEVEIQFSIEGVYFNKSKCYLNYTVYQLKIINELCQTIDSLFDGDNNGNIDSETHDVTASAIC